MVWWPQRLGDRECAKSLVGRCGGLWIGFSQWRLLLALGMRPWPDARIHQRLSTAGLLRIFDRVRDFWPRIALSRQFGGTSLKPACPFAAPLFARWPSDTLVAHDLDMRGWQLHVSTSPLTIRTLFSASIRVSGYEVYVQDFCTCDPCLVSVPSDTNHF